MNTFDFDSLPFDLYGYRIDLESDKYGVAAELCREALRGEGRQGQRKRRLLAAVAAEDEKAVCKELASIFSSALENSKIDKKWVKKIDEKNQTFEFELKLTNCVATEVHFKNNYHFEVEQDEIFELLRDFKDEMERNLNGKIAAHQKILEIYCQKHMFFGPEIWADICETLEVSEVDFARIKRIAAVGETPYAVGLDGNQMFFDFAA